MQLENAARNIKLIELLPGDNFDLIRWKFHVYAVSTCPKCIALCVDGRPFLIRKNLWDALYAIRHSKSAVQAGESSSKNGRSAIPPQTGSTSEVGWSHSLRNKLFKVSRGQDRSLWHPNLYWIDQICVNQEDLQERNHQVSLMKEIYTKATTVIAWPGIEGSAKADEGAISWMMALQLQTKYHPFKLDSDPSACEGLLSLCQRTYWIRMWIVQEIMLPSHVIFHNGCLEFQFELFLDAMEYMQKRCRQILRFKEISRRNADFFIHTAKRDLNWSASENELELEGNRRSNRLVQYVRGHEADLPPQVEEYLDAVRQHKTWDKTTKELTQSGAGRIILTKNVLGMHYADKRDITIFMLLTLCGSQDCTDIRDKVFGLLSLMSKPIIKADYSNSPQDIYYKVLQANPTIPGDWEQRNDMVSLSAVMIEVMGLDPGIQI
ncbi:hypothetical protein EJ08DRAFT_31192 [Tothia fuscella]|uniref:Heterokaryon incompatibility domain-containing protein n=1 Tax=Tothia fuscella TaxID=1048955 RepID=A0A9P4NGD4_9PEZI|nr:hypothetical protein EJ08DRAFT_31192 [Tothia fuscella]